MFVYEALLGSVLVTTLTAPTAPGALTGPASSGTGSYTIGWQSATPVVTRYELQENGSIVYSGTALSAELTGKKDGTFTYRARACNAAGCGPYTPDLLVTVELSLSAIVPDAPLVSPAVPPQGMVGSLAGAPSADGGAAGYRIEIEVPPGRAGVQPKVALTYSSKGGNGVAGVGWSVSASSTIYRCPKTLELDGASRPVQLDAQDRLCLDGQRLVLINGVHGAAGAQYVTETDPHDRITLSGDFSSSGTSIQVEHKSGRVSRYYAFTANWTTPATWYRTLEWDRQGNCQSYAYGWFSNPGGGTDTEYVLSGITYTGAGGAACTHAIANARRVTFGYTADREDKRTTYAAGQATILTARLESITTWVGETPVAQYWLGYTTSQATRRSLLTSVTKCAGAGCAAGQLPSTRFDYHQDAPFSAGTFTHVRDPRDDVTPLGPDWMVLLGNDLDGDGTRDVFYTRTPMLGAAPVDLLKLSKRPPGQGVWELTPGWTKPGAYPSPVLSSAIDIDEDGLADAPFIRSDGVLTFVGFAGGAPSTTMTAKFTTGEDFKLPPGGPSVEVSDYDGDGLVDVVVASPVYDSRSEVGATAIVMYPRVDAGRGSAVFDKAHAVVLPQPVTITYSPTLAASNCSTWAVNCDGNANWVKWVPAVGYLVGDHTGDFQYVRDGGSSQTLAHERDLSGDAKVDQYLQNAPGNASAETGVRAYLGGASFSATRSLESTTTPLVAGGTVTSGTGPYWWVDVNGDGLVDRLNIDGRVLWLNRGGIGGTAFTQVAISAIVDTDLTTPITLDSAHQVTAFPMDVDADGAAELLVPASRVSGWEYCHYEQLRGSAGEWDWFCAGDPDNPLDLRNDRSIYRWDAYKVLPAPPDRGNGTYWLVRVPTALRAPANLPRATDDFDGDGLPDVAFRLVRDVIYNAYGGGVDRVAGYYPNHFPGDADMGPYLVTNRAHAPDLLKTAVDGLGAEARWYYQPLSHPLSKGATGPSCDPSQPFYVSHNDEANREDGYVFFTSSMWAVSEFDVSHGVADAAAPLSPTCYRYEDAMLHLKGRGFQGFKKIIAEERLPQAIGEPAPTPPALSVNNRRTTTTFNQEFPFTNRVKEVAVDLVTGEPLSRTTTWWYAKLTGADKKFGPWVLYPTATKEERFDLPAAGGGILSTTTTVTEVDEVSGEAKRSCANTVDGISDASSTFTLVTRSLSNDTATWWLGKLSSVTKIVDGRNLSMPIPQWGTGSTAALIARSTDGTGQAPFLCPSVPAGSGARNTTTAYTWYDDGAALEYRRKPWTETLSVTTGGVTTEESKVTYGAYGAYGNLASRTVTARDVLDDSGVKRQLTTTFGASSDGYFIETEQNPAGHVATSVHSQAWGQPIFQQQVQNGPATSTSFDALGRVDYTHADGSQPVYQRLVGPNDAGWNSYCNPAAAQRWTIQAGAPTRIECLDILGRATATITDTFDPGGVPGEQTITSSGLNERGVKIFEHPPRLLSGAEFGTTWSDIDAFGRARRKTVTRDPALVASGEGQSVITTTYAHAGGKTTITVDGAPGGVGPLRMTRKFDARGKLIETTQDVTAAGASSPHPVVMQYDYDAGGAVTLIRDPANNDLAATYDGAGRKLTVADPDRGTWRYTWDGLGRLHTQTDARNNETEQEYDVIGRPSYRRVRAGANGATPLETWWEWDPPGQPGVLAAVHDQNGYRRGYKYDELFRPWKITTTIPALDWKLPTGSRVFVSKLGYDGMYGRVKAKGFPGVLNPAGETVVLEYTPRGFPVGESEFLGAGVVGKQYRRVRSMSARGAVTEQRLGNCVSELMHFDDSSGLMLYANASRPVGQASLPVDLGSCAAATQVLRIEEYAYDHYLNLQRQVKNMALLGLQATEVFGYDEMQRLRWSRRDWAGTSPPPHEEESYTYDDLGNILSKSNYGSAYGYGSATRPVGNAGPHAVKSVTKTDGTTASFGYDLNGNLTDGDGRHLDFDLMDRPVHVCSGPPATCEQTGFRTDFLYAPDGSRYRQAIVTPGDTKYASKTVYYVDKDYELWVWSPSSALPSGDVEERSYVSGSVVAYRREGAARELRYQSVDRLGSTELVTKDDAAATPLSQDLHGFDAFGKPRGEAWTSSGDRLHPAGDHTVTSDRGFTGHEHLDAHYLIHMNGRVYDYRLGRFLSVDPIISDPANSQSINPYSYIGNNPMSGTDPTGYFSATDGCGRYAACEVILVNPSPAAQRLYTPSNYSSGAEKQVAQVAPASSPDVQNPAQVAQATTPATVASAEVARKLGGVLLAESGATIALDRDIRDLAEGRISSNEYWERIKLRGVGAAVGVAIDAAVLGGIWAAGSAAEGTGVIGLSQQAAARVATAAPSAGAGAAGVAAVAERYASSAERSNLLQRVITSEGTLNTTNTVAQQLAGPRGFIPVQSILSAIGTGARTEDPQGVAGQFMYRASFSFELGRKISTGVLEVLVHEPSGQIRHVLYRSGGAP